MCLSFFFIYFIMGLCGLNEHFCLVLYGSLREHLWFSIRVFYAPVKQVCLLYVLRKTQIIPYPFKFLLLRGGKNER